MKEFQKDLFITLMVEKANTIKDHLKNSMNQFIIVANIGPTMAVFKIYDINEEEYFSQLKVTLSNLGDINEPDTSVVATNKLFVATILY